MDFNLNVERTFDVKLCLDILTDEDIFDSISEDNADTHNLKVDVVNDYWVKIEVDHDVIGVLQLKSMFTNCYDSHIHILPEYRRDYSEQAGELLWNWLQENVKGSLLYTNVPVFCSNVKRFLLRFGFTEQGILPKAWKKNGRQNDMIILTREV